MIHCVLCVGTCWNKYTAQVTALMTLIVTGVYFDLLHVRSAALTPARQKRRFSAGGSFGVLREKGPRTAAGRRGLCCEARARDPARAAAGAHGAGSGGWRPGGVHVRPTCGRGGAACSAHPTADAPSAALSRSQVRASDSRHSPPWCPASQTAPSQPGLRARVSWLTRPPR